MRLAVEDLGYAMEPQFQVVTEDGRVIATVDGRIIGTRGLLEFDGLTKYAGVDGKRELIAEKRREEDIRRADWLLDRFVWHEVDDPAGLARRLRHLVGGDRAG